jgi:hypothetical protein
MNVFVFTNQYFLTGYNLSQDVLGYSSNTILKGLFKDINNYHQKINSNHTANLLSNQFEL